MIWWLLSTRSVVLFCPGLVSRVLKNAAAAAYFALSPSTAAFDLRSCRRPLLFGMTSSTVLSSGGVQIM